MNKESMAVDERALFRLASFATLATLVIIPVQILVFVVYPMPQTVAAWLAEFQGQILIGMFHSDFFMLVDNILIIIIYLAFYRSLKGARSGLLEVAIVLGLVGIAAYISSNKTFELMDLAGKLKLASGESERNIILAAGQAMLSAWQGTAFDVYYALNGLTLLIVSFLMLGSSVFGRVTAYWGLAAGFFMTIPSTAGMLGLVFSLVSLLPWYVFSVRFGLVFLRLSKGVQVEE